MASKKMCIVAYKTNKYLGRGIGRVVVKINPASYRQKQQVSYNERMPSGKNNFTPKFNGMPAQVISFEIYFDGTGAIKNIKQSVEDQIKKFKSVCIDYDGDIHEPNYLIISWGSLVFKCKLTSLSINYTLFNSDGKPLRAKASVSFKQALDQDMINKIGKLNSPDLTHYVLFKEGDSLPLICKDVYGDPSYYLDVARHNNLVNFRNIKPGTKLYLPPIK